MAQASAGITGEDGLGGCGKLWMHSDGMASMGIWEVPTAGAVYAANPQRLGANWKMNGRNIT